MPRSSQRLRSIDILTVMSPRPLWRLLRGVARAPFDRDYAGSALAVCWFTNFSCNARCHFCCKAEEIRRGHEAFPPLDLDSARELLRRIRRTVGIIYLSGGEPLMHPRLIDILRQARDLKFHSVGMSTNLITLDRHTDVLEYLDAISVSIHSPEKRVHARNLGVSGKVAERVWRNLDLLAQHPHRPQRVIINCVINATNLATILPMVDWTRDRGFLLELVPANEHGRAPRDLSGNPEYESLIDRIIELRRSGQAEHVAGSTGYYRRIRSFEPFRCFPYGVPNIMPDGRLCTPCDVSGQYAVNLLNYRDLKSALRASRPHLGDYPCRKGHCFKAGILERSRLFGLMCRRKKQPLR